MRIPLIMLSAVMLLLTAACTNVNQTDNSQEEQPPDVNENNPGEEENAEYEENEQHENEPADSREEEEEEEAELTAETEAGEIFRDDFLDTLEAMYGEEVLRLMITLHMLEQEAEAAGITEADYEAEIERMLTSMGLEGGAGTEAAVAAAGVHHEKELRADILKRLVIEERLDIETDIAETDLQEAYEKGSEANVRHILVSEEERAEELLEELEAGADFSELASSYSQDPATAAEGGETGYFRRGTMTPMFERAAFSLEEGTFSDPVPSTFGYHIIEVIDRLPFEDSYEEVSDQLYASLQEQVMYEMSVEETIMMDEFDVSIYDEAYDHVLDDDGTQP
ncbi:peptidylprolyl isomerase [Alkalicoccus chagannorensis]|uniref:peptidylprolyl isomerase n=1 Tax=Alkalicoccus chagannorensis TaxID=427072 RepID=UPI0003FF2048|nr:peptidylprolyl isomerase [Alkalicoccus chagannorensis]